MATTPDTGTDKHTDTDTGIDSGDAQPDTPVDESAIVPATRTGTAWLMIAFALLLGLLMLVFILQNGDEVALELLWADFRLPLGVAVMLGMVVGGLLVVLVTAARLTQVKLAARRHRRAHRA